MPASPLTVELAGHRRRIERPDGATTLTFGRGAELDVDSNPFLHRQVGRLVADDDLWWIECLGEWTPLTVTSDGCSAQLTHRSRVPITHHETVIRFGAGACNYELRVHLDEPPTPSTLPVGPPPDGITATFRALELPLNDEQRLMVLALAEGRLRTPERPTVLPSNVAAAQRLGWSTAKYNRKLDWLCHKLHQQGVAGMKAERRRANDRRRLLVEHMVGHGYVTAADLVLLDDHIRALDTGDPS